MAWMVSDGASRRKVGVPVGSSAPEPEVSPA